MHRPPRKRFLNRSPLGWRLAMVLPAVVVAAVLPTLPASAAAGIPTGAWKDQVIMTVELAKFAGQGADFGYTADNSVNSNDIQRLQFALDDPANQPPKYTGSGMFGGDLVGFRNKVAHLKSLGITTTIIYPVMESDRQDFFGNLPTGYGTRNFGTLDANFRGNGQSAANFSAYTNLISDLHNTSIGGYRVNVLQDLAMAGTGFEHTWFTPEAAATNIDKFRRWDPTNMDNNSGAWDASGATTFYDAVFVDIAGTFNTDAFSYTGSTSNGNFDGAGNTFPAETVGASSYGVVGYDSYLGYLYGQKQNGRNNATAGSSTVSRLFDFPSPVRRKYGTLGVAAAAVGADRTVTFRVTYSDSSTQDTTVTVPRWDPVAAPASFLAQFPRKNTPAGSVATPVYLHNLMLGTDPTKQVNSVRLQPSADAAQTRVFGIGGLPVTSPVRVDLTSSYNEDGIATNAAMGNGNLNGSGLLFPVEGLFRPLTPNIVGVFPTTAPTTPANARFVVGPRIAGRNNMVKAAGQAVDVVDQRYHYFRLAAFATGASSRAGQFRVNYTDGTNTMTTLTIKPLTASVAGGDVLVHQGDYAQRFNGTAWVNDNTIQPKIWGLQLPADWTKTVASITMPNDADIHVAAINPTILLDSGFGVPLLNHSNGQSTGTGMYQEFLNTASFWMNMGLDGLRIDSVQKFYPGVFSQAINTSWATNFPGRWLFGEAAVAEPSQGNPTQQPLPWQLHREEYTNPSSGVNFNGVYDFETADGLRDTFGKQASASADPDWSLIDQSIEWDNRYEQPWNQVAFFDVYENFPFLAHATGATYADKLPKLRLAAAYLFSINRVPMLFSGNEYLLNYGGEEPAGSNARRPGYLFSTNVTGNSAYQDNNALVKALVSMRKGSEALRSEERMTNGTWFIQGDSLFGFVRQSTTGEKVVAVFNNSPNTVSSFDSPLPAGVTGSNNHNYVKKVGAAYGAADPTVSFPTPATLRISTMNPWEAKIIRISP